MATNLPPRRSLSRYLLILVSLLTLAGFLGGCGTLTTTGSSHPSGLTPTATRSLKGMISEFRLHTSNAQTGDITVGPDGNLWFTEIIPGAQKNGSVTITGKIGRITPAGQISEFALPSNSYGRGITAGPDGNLWFTEIIPNLQSGKFVGKIGRITPAGQISEFPVPTSSNLLGIAAGPGGNLWFTEFQSGKIGRITPAGQISEFALPSNSQPTSITSGPDGALWFTETASNKGQSGKIGRITPAGQISEFALPSDNQPGDITVGPDGALWFTGTQIGRITPAGQVSEFPLPSSSNGGEITAGPDGALWFTEFGSNKIGRLA